MLEITTPHNVSHRHAEAVRAISMAFIKDPEVAPLTSIVVGGSVARGTATLDSDIDLFVTFRGNWCQRRRQVIDGLAFDVFIDPVAQAEHLMGSGINDVMIENYADGWIIFDPTGFAKRSKDLARSLLSRSRRAPSEGEVYMLCERADDRLKALSASQSDRLVFGYIAAVFIAEAVEAFYVLRRLWRPRAKSVPNDLKKHQPAFSDDLQTLCSENSDIVDKVSAARRVTESILQTGRGLGYKPGNGPKTLLRPGPGIMVRVGEQTIAVPKAH